MPDPTGKTISASRVAGLFDIGPAYMPSRWMLWQHFANNVPLDEPPADADQPDRRWWGLRIEPVILEWASERLRLDKERRQLEQRYVRHPELALGATMDMAILDPTRGLGCVEVKNVDGFIYRQEWDADRAPDHIEVQLQCQMMVGDGKSPCTWGAIAALVGGNEGVLIQREPDEAMQRRIREEITSFFEEVAEGREPDPAGNARELGILRALHPELEHRTASVMTEEAADHAVIYTSAAEMEKSSRATKEKARLALERLADGAQVLNVPGWEASFNDVTIKAHTRKESTSRRMRLRPVDL